MDSIIPLLVVALWSARTCSEPLPEAVARRSDKGVYASEFAREYEPMTFAAVPLHSPIPLRAPIPVFHVLSPAPAPRPAPRPAPSAQRPLYARPYSYAHQYTNSQPYAASQTYAVSRPYASSYAGSYVMYASDDADDSAPAPSVLYARPTPDGGYTYRRRPTRKRPAKRPAPHANEPVLIRVHKYRIIRDR